jgi:hypothetical protein
MLQQYDRVMRDRMTKYRTLERRYERIFKADEDVDVDDERVDDDSDEERLDGEADSNEDGDEPRHLVDTLADLMVESGSPDGDGEITREQALQYLLHSERGQALVERMSRKRISNRKDSAMDRSDELRAMVHKHHGIDGLCRDIVKKGTTTVTEHELCGMLTASAQARFADISGDRAFTKLVSGPNGLAFRQAIEVAKASSFANTAYPWPTR